jgi:adenine-specific DNA-methyltransferase
LVRNARAAVPAALRDHIHPGDCLELLRRLPSASVDLIVSSPPYNIGKPYEKRSSLDRYLTRQAIVLEECARVLRHSGSIFWQVGVSFEMERHIPLDIRLFPILEEIGLIPCNRIVWVRPHGYHANRRFSGRHETLLWFAKSPQYQFFLDAVRVPQKYRNKKHWKGKNQGRLSCDPLGKNPGDVWAFRNVRHNHEEHTIHPAQFPEDLVERILLATTSKRDVVLDPYMGVGTVAVVAQRWGRTFLGAETNGAYRKVAAQRLRGAPDKNGNFPNLRTLREFAHRHELADLSRYSFTRQTGRNATAVGHSKITPEPVQLQKFLDETRSDVHGAVYKRVANRSQRRVRLV